MEIAGRLSARLRGVPQMHPFGVAGLSMDTPFTVNGALQENNCGALYSLISTGSSTI